MRQAVGTCSICGGKVYIPILWAGVVPPVPCCASCGANAASRGPVIPMQPRLPPPVLHPLIRFVLFRNRGDKYGAR